MNIYLIAGESFRLVEEEINKIVKNSNNILTMDLITNSIQEVITEATYVSMFNEQKYIIVKNASFFSTEKGKESDIELLLKYLENPVSLTTIIFVTYSKIDSRKKITKIIDSKYKIINIGNLNRNDLIIKIRDYINQEKYKASTEVINYIIDCCYANYDLIITELNKIFLYYNKPGMIELEDVKNIVSRSLVDNNFKFVEAVINKNLILASKILDDLYILKVDPINLLMLLAREYRLMYSVYYMYSEGHSKNDIKKEFNIQDWQLDKLLRNASSYSMDTLLLNIKSIAEYDYLIKSGQMDKFMALKLFLLNIE